MALKCQNIELLKSYLGQFEHELSNKPNGQSMYKFPNGLVLNLYETGSVVFQGENVTGDLVDKITNFINSVNA